MSDLNKKVVKIGNGLFVCIDKAVLKLVGAELGSEFIVRVTGKNTLTLELKKHK